MRRDDPRTLALHRNGVLPSICRQCGRIHSPRQHWICNGLAPREDPALDARLGVLPTILAVLCGSVIVYGLGWGMVLAVCAVGHWVGVW